VQTWTVAHHDHFALTKDKIRRKSNVTTVSQSNVFNLKEDIKCILYSEFIAL
jgi:hypothetical protein